MATRPCASELVGFLYSLSLHHPGAVVYVEADSVVRDAIQSLSLQPRLDLRIRVTLDMYSSRSRTDMTQDGTWARFQMSKADALDAALADYPDALFLDSDTLITAPLLVPAPESGKRLGVSPGFIPERKSAEVGFYNGGMLWVRRCSAKEDPSVADPSTSITQLWRKFTLTSRYYDQGSIEDVVRTVGPEATHVFGPEFNLQGWRWILSGHGEVLKHLSPGRGCILWDKKVPLRFIHTHFGETRFAQANAVLVDLMVRSRMPAHLLIIERIVRGGWVVILPKQPAAIAKYRHADDSFRELARMWSVETAARAGKDAAAEVVVHSRPDEVHCWLGARRHVLLFDRDCTHPWVDDTALRRPLRTLVGNTGREVLPNALPWIYWPRRPAHLAQFLADGRQAPGALDHPREKQIVFIAAFHNPKQVGARRIVLDDPGWRRVVDDWHVSGATAFGQLLGAANAAPLTTREYIARIAEARFGLCVPGYGPKCHREVELMAVGCVPIVLPGVDISDYAEPPVEGTHYLKARSPQDAESFKSMSHEEWLRMSQACRQWYERNASVKGSLRRTLELALYGSSEAGTGALQDSFTSSGALQDSFTSSGALHYSEVEELRARTDDIEAATTAALRAMGPSVQSLVGAQTPSHLPPRPTQPAAANSPSLRSGNLRTPSLRSASFQPPPSQRLTFVRSGFSAPALSRTRCTALYKRQTSSPSLAGARFASERFPFATLGESADAIASLGVLPSEGGPAITPSA